MISNIADLKAVEKRKTRGIEHKSLGRASHSLIIITPLLLRHLVLYSDCKYLLDTTGHKEGWMVVQMKSVRGASNEYDRSKGLA
jgi:hypothetical protein